VPKPPNHFQGPLTKVPDLDYEYYPLGKYIVSARGICYGRPTFINTRLDVIHVLHRINSGEDTKTIVACWPDLISGEAVEEARQLLDKYGMGLFWQELEFFEETAATRKRCKE